MIFIESIFTIQFSWKKNSINSANVTLCYSTVRPGNAASREMLLAGNKRKYKKLRSIDFDRKNGQIQKSYPSGNSVRNENTSKTRRYPVAFPIQNARVDIWNKLFFAFSRMNFPVGILVSTSHPRHVMCKVECMPLQVFFMTSVRDKKRLRKTYKIALHRLSLHGRILLWCKVYSRSPRMPLAITVFSWHYTSLNFFFWQTWTALLHLFH